MTQRVDGKTFWLSDGIELERVLAAVASPGVTLKESSKSLTRRVGDWVIKSSRFEGGLGILKHTLLRERYRRAWRAANHLLFHGVKVPSPIAYIEHGRFGLITGNVFVSEYLNGFINVEQYAAALHRETANEALVADFLLGLAEAVNALCRTGAFHADLSGKNIFTQDGQSFCFIDLDGVILGQSYTRERRMKNHVQLYDSFCDLYDETLLGPFIKAMVSDDEDGETWLRAVQRGQQQRRNDHVSRT